jgi:hypothetical protein
MEQQARVAKVSSKDNRTPLMAPDPLDRQAGVYAKGLRLINGKKFKALDESNKQHVLGQYYDTWVAPAYTSSHAAPPDKDTWIREFGKPGGPKMQVSDFYLNTGKAADAVSDEESMALNMGATATKTLANLANGAIMAGMKVNQKLFGLKGFFPAPQTDTWRDKLLNIDKSKPVQSFMKMNQGLIDDSNFWFQSRPSRTFSEKAGSFIGEQSVQLPLYEAIGSLRGLGATVSGIDKLLKVSAGTGEAIEAAKAANLTRRLVATPIGRFVGKRLGEAADAYIGATLLQSSSEDRTRDVLAFMGFGAALEGLGIASTKLISKTAMKKQLAHDAAIGGLPYVEAVADQASHELNNDIIGYDHSGSPLQAHAGHNLADLKEAVGIANDADPIKAATTTAAKMSLTSLAKEKYGEGVIWKNLARSKQDAIRKEYAKRTAEAVEEIPIHVPEVAQHEIQESIKKDVAQSPQLEKTYSDIENLAKSLGIQEPVTEIIRQAEVSDIKQATGIKSVQGATYKVANVTRKIEPILKEPKKLEDQIFSDLADSGNLRYNSGDQGYNVKFESKVDKALYRLNGTDPTKFNFRVSQLKRLQQYFPEKTVEEITAMAKDVKSQLDAEIKERRGTYHNDPEVSNVLFPSKYARQVTGIPATKEAVEAAPRNYVSFKVNTLSGFTNRISDAAKKKNKTLANYLRGLDDNEFIEEVGDQMGNNIRFEKPQDLMLWAVHHGDNIPAPIYNRAVSWLKDQDPTQTVESLRKQGKVLDNHIEMLAYSGRLDVEGNVFRSTVTSDYGSRTKWQRRLLADVSKEEVADYSATMGSYKKNFPEAYNQGLQTLAKLQAARSNLKTLEAAIEKTREIRKIILSGPIKSTEPFGINALERHGYEAQ